MHFEKNLLGERKLEEFGILFTFSASDKRVVSLMVTSFAAIHLHHCIGGSACMYLVQHSGTLKNGTEYLQDAHHTSVMWSCTVLSISPLIHEWCSHCELCCTTPTALHYRDVED